jgi:hypothetical protein
MAAKTYPNPPQPQTQQAQDRHQPDERGEAQLALRELTAWHPGLLVGQFSALFSEAVTTLPSEYQLDARKQVYLCGNLDQARQQRWDTPPKGLPLVTDASLITLIIGVAVKLILIVIASFFKTKIEP